MRHQKGFTLVEILLVVFLGAIILTIGFFSSYGSSFLSDTVRSHTDMIIGMMRKAQAQSLSGVQGAPFTVHLNYQSLQITPSNETLSLEDVTISNVQLLDSSNQITFSTSRGTPSTSGSFEVRGFQGQHRIVVISPSGAIDWQLP